MSVLRACYERAMTADACAVVCASRLSCLRGCRVFAVTVCASPVAGGFAVAGFMDGASSLQLVLVALVTGIVSY